MWGHFVVSSSFIYGAGITYKRGIFVELVPFVIIIAVVVVLLVLSLVGRERCGGLYSMGECGLSDMLQLIHPQVWSQLSDHAPQRGPYVG
jgi:Na+/pantothenate symporter